ncbi:unnamed protein product [Phytophthora fragariaefolia]|uniref:Unnamed protein product n=1 Tax=Phytophthora fragariaefolia TaxID=1490495 RepID=A0A9W7D682_9STRA|nr:unnamed protein product [Phytophthora fragariaefolia]
MHDGAHPVHLLVVGLGMHKARACNSNIDLRTRRAILQSIDLIAMKQQLGIRSRSFPAAAALALLVLTLLISLLSRATGESPFSSNSQTTIFQYSKAQSDPRNVSASSALFGLHHHDLVAVYAPLGHSIFATEKTSICHRFHCSGALAANFRVFSGDIQFFLAVRISASSLKYRSQVAVLTAIERTVIASTGSLLPGSSEV